MNENKEKGETTNKRELGKKKKVTTTKEKNDEFTIRLSS